MMEMVLDRESDAPVQTGFFLVTSEVTFLDAACDSQQPLHVRGPSLCTWAEAFCEARSIPYRYVESPTREIQAACPALDRAGALALYNHLQGVYFRLPRPLAAADLLGALYPVRFWHDPPSAQHAAEWLLLLIDKPIAEEAQPLVAQVCAGWRNQVGVSEQAVYQAQDRERALQVLDGWLGLAATPVLTSLGEFPLALPPALQQRAAAHWRQCAIETQGDYFTELKDLPIPKTIKQIAASATAAYFRDHPQGLDKVMLAALGPYLSLQAVNELRQWVRPDTPPPMPELPADVLQWFRSEYLPFRQWQASYGDNKPEDSIQRATAAFAIWYLSEYSAALNGGRLQEHLSFVRSARLATSDAAVVTLLVVPDGLHVADAHYLQQAVTSRTNRLTVALDGLTFAPIPTITQFCKPALFHGIQPSHVDEVSPIGTVLPERVLPVASLKHAHPGELFLWRILEPDNTYHHRNNFDTLRRQVEGQLDVIAQNIADIVQGVPETVRLRIVITTDHGRLLAESRRTRLAPSGMEVHGRTAWGQCNKDLDNGFLVEDDIAYLHHDSFGLPADTAVILDESSFPTSDGRGGSELFPHGGIYPEEVIIPWLVYERDFVAPEVKLVLSGSGEANKPGTVRLRAINLGTTRIILEKIELTAPGVKRELPVDLAVAPSAAEETMTTIDVWPSQQQVRSMNAVATVRLPNGLTFTATTQVDLQSQEMYEREDILEGLEL